MVSHYSLAAFLKLAHLFKLILSKTFQPEASTQQYRKFLGMVSTGKVINNYK